MAEKIGVEDYIKAAEERLRAAKKEYEVGLFSSAVLSACLAIDNIVNAFLMVIGARAAKRHRWTLAIINAVRLKKPEFLRMKSFTKMLELIKDIEAGAHMIRSRYPFTFRGRKFVPNEFYTNEVTKEVLEKANEILARITKVIAKARATGS